MAFLPTNVSMYKEIVEEAFSSMRFLLDEGRTANSDGSKGDVIKYDPNHKSFKQSMIVIVFTGMWLEARLHQDIISKFNYATFKEYDRKPYRDKLVLLGINDPEFLSKVDSFKDTRKELVHEKAYKDLVHDNEDNEDKELVHEKEQFDSKSKRKIKIAEKEAELAYKIMVYLNNKG